MKKIALTITAALFLIGCGKGEGKPEGKSSGQEFASAKEPHDESGNPTAPKGPKIPPIDPKKKALTKTIPTRVPLRTIPTRKTEEQADKNSTVPTNPEEALVGSWMYSQDGFVFTIFLEKDGKGKVRIEEGDQKADFPMSWNADAEKLTLVNKDPKTQDEDVTEGAYKLSNEGGVKLLQLEYELEKQNFTFVGVVRDKKLKEKGVGTYEFEDASTDPKTGKILSSGGDVHRLVFLENGVVERYRNGRLEASGAKWNINKNGELNLESSHEVIVWRLNPEGSITKIHWEKDGKDMWGDRPGFLPEITYKKIK